MSLTELLGQLQAADVRLRVEGSDLHVSAAKRTIPPELRKAIECNKAELIEALRGTTTQRLAGMTALEPRRRQGPCELSFAQERLWFLSRLEPENPFYNVPAALALRGKLDETALERALDEIVRRHDGLRTVFRETEGRPEQHVLAHMPLKLTRIFVAGEEADSSARARTIAGEEALQPFDLANGPLIRASLVTFSPESHLLLVTMHHIVSDGWSISVLLNELSLLYAAFSKGRTSPLAPLRLQYPDFSVWQRQVLQRDSLDGLIRHWREVLADAPRSIPLPLDRKRPEVQSFAGGIESIRLDPALTARLEALSRAAGGTVFMTLLAGFAALLSRYSGQGDMVIGTAIANRNHRDIEGLIGFFVNVLALRINTAGEPSFSELIERARRVALDAYDHQDLPFETLVDALGIERDAGGNPLFQVLFAQQNTKKRVQLEGLDLEVVRRGTVSAKFDLYVSVENAGAGLDIHLEYRSDLFEAATARRMLRHYRELLKSAAADPSQPVNRWPLMEDEERERVLHVFSRGAAPIHRQATIHEAIAARVQAEPERIAVAFGDSTLSYREMELRSNRLAHRLLRETNGAARTPIGVSLDRCLDLPVVLLAILKAGGAYAALDPQYPRARIAQMLDDLRPSIVITNERLRHRLPESCRTLLIDEEMFAGELETCPRVQVDEGDIAYVCFTSGTSGRPKGAAIPHRAVIRLATDASYADFGQQYTWLQISPVAFDASTLELWACLVNGGKLVVMAPGTPSLDDIAQTIRKHQVTAAWLTAGLFHLMADERIETFSELKLLLAGGDVLSPRHVARVLARCPGLTLVNGYGPTENTTFTCCHAMRHDSENPDSIPIGRPVAGTEVYILDAYLRPLPAGIPGQLFAAGAGLASGYVNRAALTAAAFVPNPFGAPGDRMYQTGDRARWRDDGTIEFLGRADDQVKLRGFRVEPREIEATLAEHPAIDQCAVIAAGEGDERRLAAYFVSKSAESTGHGSLSDEHVVDWKTLYEQTYAQAEAADPTFNISGWNSSFDGRPIPEDEMREWLEATLSRIRSLGAKRILEIGCGTGLLLFRLAPDCERYVGIDFSAAAVERLRRLRHLVSAECNLEILERSADDLSGFEENEFDLVILNSVTQYFPNAQYLRSVLLGSARLVRPGGHIFAGDIRSLPLLPAFHAAVEFSRTQRSASRDAFARTARTRLQQERELAIDPHLFSNLMLSESKISLVQAQSKRGSAENELTRFRYDVTLHVGDEPASAPIDWRDGSMLDETEIVAILTSLKDSTIGFSGILNARLATEERILAWMQGDGDATLQRAGELWSRLSRTGVSVERICRLAEERGYRTAMQLNPKDPFRFDVAFTRGRDVVLGFPSDATLRELANNPLREKQSRQLGDDLREFLGARLPSWMVPSVFVPLDLLPLNANGKVDRKALPTIERSDLATRYEAPITATERQLVKIWSEVLGVDRTGVTDNFFELGGDSILAIQIVARARAAGLAISPREMFQYQTIRELAEFAETSAMATRAHQGPVTGEAPLTAIQHWLVDRRIPSLHHFNQSLLLRIRGNIDSRRLREAFAEILSHHDALRLRYEGGTRQSFAEVAGEVPFEEIRLSHREEIGAVIARLQASLDLARGPITRMARIVVAGEDLLFWTVHHMAVDGVSWRILLEDFDDLCAGRGQLPPKTASFRDWAEACSAFAVSPNAEAELPLWIDQDASEELRVDHPEVEGPFEAAAEGPAYRKLTEPETTALLATSTSGRGMNEILLAAAARSVAVELGAKDSVAVNMESHGRVELEEAIDVSRTCGWFTAVYPLKFQVPRSATWQEWLGQAGSALKKPSRHGAGFGMLRCLGRPEVRERLAALRAPQMALNYLGRFDRVVSVAGPFELTTESTEPNAAPGTPLAHALEINAVVRNGRLEVRWDYCGRRFDRPTIERIADRCLVALLEHGTVAANGHLAVPVAQELASDFPEIDLSGSFLDEIEELARAAGGDQ